MIVILGKLTFFEYPEGRKSPIKSRYSPNFIINNVRYSGVIKLVECEFLLPGQSTLAEVEIPNKYVDLKFIEINAIIQFWEGAKLVGNLLVQGARSAD